MGFHPGNHHRGYSHGIDNINQPPFSNGAHEQHCCEICLEKVGPNGFSVFGRTSGGGASAVSSLLLPGELHSA